MRRPWGDTPSREPLAADRRISVFLFVLDAAAGTAAWTITTLLAPWTGTANLTAGRIAVVAFATVTLLVSALHQRLYRIHTWETLETQLRTVWHAAVTAGVVVLAMPSLFNLPLSIIHAGAGASLSFAMMAVMRLTFRRWLYAQRRRGYFTRSVVVVGTGAQAAGVVKYLTENREAGYSVVGILGSAPVPELDLRVPWLGPLTDAVGAVRRTGATGAVIASGDLEPAAINSVARRLLAAGFAVQLSGGLRGLAYQRLLVEPLAQEPFLYLRPVSFSRRQLLAKRTLDVCGSCILLILTAPVLLAAAVAIKREDGGTVLFRQQRVGLEGQIFTIYKLRTMVADAERQVAVLLPHNTRTGPLFKVDADPRVTRVGELLRLTSIDELPQLVNVLRGDMSLVGPRPALPAEVEQFDEELRTRAKVLPGLTGLWQVNARDEPSFDRYRSLDVFYVENWCLLLDVRLLLATVGAVAGRALRPLRQRSADVVNP